MAFGTVMDSLLLTRSEIVSQGIFDKLQLSCPVQSIGPRYLGVEPSGTPSEYCTASYRPRDHGAFVNRPFYFTFPLS